MVSVAQPRSDPADDVNRSERRASERRASARRTIGRVLGSTASAIGGMAARWFGPASLPTL